ncbi:MAG: hypothetical protein AAF517_04150 [Planctomycetota bacterium]
MENILGEIVGVRDVLKKMCKVSVTRTSLKNAVREALIPVIEEHRDQLFPEIVELRERLAQADDDPTALDPYRGTATSASQVEAAAATDDFVQRLKDFEARIERLSELDTKFQDDLSTLETRQSEQFDRLASDISSLEGRSSGQVDDLKATFKSELEGEFKHGIKSEIRDEFDAKLGGEFKDGFKAELKQELEEQLQSERLSVDEKVAKVQDYLTQLESTMPQVAKDAAGEVESRLRAEIESMVEQLTEKMGEVKAVLDRLESFVPRKEQLEAVGQRLDSLEASFAKVADQVGSIDSAVVSTMAPEIASLNDRFSSLRTQITDATDSLQQTNGEVKSALSSRLGDLQSVLQDGITRWERDQSEMQERLTGLRDSLRDQLSGLSDQVATDKGSLWDKISGKKEAGVKLSGEAFDDLSTKLEGIIGGLEKVISKKKPN